jgi:predicted O-methyltransferase YrrM
MPKSAPVSVDAANATKPGIQQTPTQVWSAVDRYIADLFVPFDPMLNNAIELSAAMGLPAHEVSPAQGKFLMLLARIQGARTILEIGTLGGVSTIWLARALPVDGRLVSLEFNPKHAEVARANIERAALDHLVEVRVGPALDTLPMLAAEHREPFDFIFIDADKRNNTEYLRWALKLSRRGTVIVADNTIREGAVIEADSNDPSVQGVRRFNEFVRTEPCLSVTALQTVGSKGYDGFTLMLVTGDPAQQKLDFEIARR